MGYITQLYLIFVTFQELCYESLRFVIYYFSEQDHPELRDLCNFHVKPGMCSEWHDVEQTLNIAERKLREIDANSPSKCCRKIFSHRLQKDVNTIAENLMAALESPGVEHNSL